MHFASSAASKEAATLTEEQLEQIRSHVRARQGHKGGNQKRIGFSKEPTDKCSVCFHCKHAVKWAEMRDAKHGTLPRGALCYACHRATLALGAHSRCRDIFAAVPGAMSVWRYRSQLERAKLLKYDGDENLHRSCVLTGGLCFMDWAPPNRHQTLHFGPKRNHAILMDSWLTGGTKKINHKAMQV